MRKLTILALILLFFAGGTKAQLRYGVKGGANVTDILTDNDIVDDVDMALHGQFGIVIQYRMGNFGIQPELLYSEKGGILNDANASHYLTLHANLSAENPNIKFVSKNIEIPLNLQYGVKLGKTRVYIQGAPYISFLTGGLINGDKELYKQVNEELEFNKVDFGLGLGAGVEFKHLQLSAKYDFGLIPVGKEKLNSVSEVNMNPFHEMKNRNLSVSMAYLF